MSNERTYQNSFTIEKRNIQLRFDHPRHHFTYKQALESFKMDHTKRYTLLKYKSELKDVTELLNNYFKYFGLELDLVRLREKRNTNQVQKDKKTFDFAVSVDEGQFNFEKFNTLKMKDQACMSEKNYLSLKKLMYESNLTFPSLSSQRRLQEEFKKTIELKNNSMGIILINLIFPKNINFKYL